MGRIGPIKFLSLPLFRSAAHQLTDFDWHCAGRSCGRRRQRSAGGDFVSLLRVLYIDDPPSGEELLGFRKWSIGDDRRTVFGCVNDLRLVWPCKASGCNKHARFLEFLVEIAHENHIRLEILLRPLGIPIKHFLRAAHHQHVFHWLAPFDFSSELMLSWY